MVLFCFANSDVVGWCNSMGMLYTDTDTDTADGLASPYTRQLANCVTGATNAYSCKKSSFYTSLSQCESIIIHLFPIFSLPPQYECWQIWKFFKCLQEYWNSYSRACDFTCMATTRPDRHTDNNCVMGPFKKKPYSIAELHLKCFWCCTNAMFMQTFAMSVISEEFM